MDVLAERLEPAALVDLCLASRHSAAVQRERHDLIAGRVRLIAGLFSVLTLAWIPIDAFNLPGPYWADLAIGRVAASVAFLALAVRPASWRMRGGAAVEVSLLIAVPLAFFLYSNEVLSVAGQGDAIALATAYFYLPFIIATGLGIFPLTLIEALVPAGFIVAAMTLAVEVWPYFLGGQSEGATVWRLLLIATIAALAGLSQLRFLLRLTDMAKRDGLTNLLVRGTGEEILRIQFAYAHRHDLPFAVIFLDIDHFKSINDEFGHDAGDAALRTVAAQITRAFRNQDVMIRWGGEEFVIGLPGADPVSAEVAVLRLAKLGLGLRPDYRPITASIGIAERQADAVDSFTALVERADARMYEAKKAGRNRYIFKARPKVWLALPGEGQNVA